MKICIITDDNAGFTKEEAKELGITLLRMPMIIDGEVYFQDENITEDQFFEILNSDRNVSTSQPSPGEVMGLWEEKLKTYDQIVHIPMSSGLSYTTQTAINLSQQDEFKGKVYVVDNHRIEPTLKCAVKDAIKLANEGKDAKEIKEILEKTSSNASIYVIVDTLKFLKKGGRVTPAAALLGGALHIKPILCLFSGKLDAYAKALGTKKARVLLLDAVKKELNTKFKDTPKEKLSISLCYSHNKEEALEFLPTVKEELGFDNIQVAPLSLVVSVHTGPGVIAIAVSKTL